jgi:hypothetical protein
MRVADARSLVELFDLGLVPDAARGLVGGVPLTTGRRLFVKRWETAVSITETPDTHSGHTLCMRDRVEARRDALDRATSGADSRAA